MNKFFDAVQVKTEAYLTNRKAQAKYKKEHRTFISETLEWLDALAFGVIVVLIINLVLFQLFIIPSPSMQDTLLIGDRVFVGKFAYGIEVYPGGPKIFAGRIPNRDEIITFYNPDYKSKGAFFDIISTIIYMATLSLVNIDRDEEGNIREKLLVKRCAAEAGDTVTFIDGDAYIRPSGTLKYENEKEWRALNGMSQAPHRTIEESTYDFYNAAGILQGLEDKGVSSRNMPRHLVLAASGGKSDAFYTDYYGYDTMVYTGRCIADPSDRQARSDRAKQTVGIYVPEGYVLPLGDNRDNSSDGRYFGPVSSDSVNGHVNSVIWPISRVTTLRNK